MHERLIDSPVGLLTLRAEDGALTAILFGDQRTGLPGSDQIMDQAEAELKEYFAVRSAFFKTAPVYQRIFCDAVIAPPEHLRKQVQDRRESFDRLNLQILEQILRPLPLRPGVSRTEVIETFRMFQDFINVRCQMTGADGQNFEVREENCQKALDILLYGVVERGCPGPA